MAIVEETIGSGKDRATPTLWEANVGVFGTDTYKGIIQESAEFAPVTLQGSSGTPSITSYLWLTTDPANRHAGVAGTGHGRMRGATSGTHVINVDAPFTRVDWLDIQQDSASDSDEGIRILNNADDTLIDYCIVWTDTDTENQDGIYTGDWNIDRIRISNCIVYGWRRVGIFVQQFGAAPSKTISMNVDHCSINDCGVTGQSESAAFGVRSEGNSDAITVTVFNTWGAGTAENAPFNDGTGTAQPSTPDGTVTWNGSDNGRDDTTDHIQGTDNTTAWEDATDGIVAVTKSTGSWIVVTNLTAGSEDLTLLDDAAGNLMAGNGVDRQGSEPDARQDFSVAIDGSRPTSGVDIGASQVSVVAGAAPVLRRRQRTTVRI